MSSIARLEHIRLTVVKGVGWLRFDRPPVNAFNRLMLDEVGMALDALIAEPGVRVIVLGTASDTHFSAGADLAVFRDATDAQMRDWVFACHRLARRLREGEKPILAAIRGIAVGGGLEMSLHADLRFAETTARLGQPEINIAFIPPVAGTQALVRLVGRSAAFRMLYTGEVLAADQAQEIGLVDTLCQPGALEKDTQDFAEALADRPTNALAAVRRCLTAGADISFEDGLAIEAREAERLIDHGNFREGISAFLSKREPQWH
jgi:enoyl-CoA hydratase/carnithine racemase